MPPQRQQILMCAPDYFGVDYVINKWMEHQIGQVDRPLAVTQWQYLHDALAQHADIALVAPQAGVPDMVFTANAGLVYQNNVIVSRFRAKEREAEEPYFKAWFEQNKFTLVDWPENVAFEGAGDALLDRGQPILWIGNGFRSDTAAPALVERHMGLHTVSLKLIDPRFYHLDTCLCPLEDGWMLYFPAAFDAESQEKIKTHVPENKRIAVAESDAVVFACNAVNIGHHVFLNTVSDDLQNKLRRAGFTPVLTPISEFLKAGGGSKCLTLKLVEP